MDLETWPHFSLGDRVTMKTVANQFSIAQRSCLKAMGKQQKAPTEFRWGLSSSVDLNLGLIPDQPIAGAWSATGVDSAAARSRGKL